jgi:type III pantothenate kinase
VLIAVDIGNSLTKVGWFDEAARGPLSPRAEGTISSESGAIPQPAVIRRFFTGGAVPDELLAELPRQAVKWRVVSVNSAGLRAVTESIRSARPQDDLRVLTRTDFPIALRVDQPDRVGLDRLASAVAADAIRDPDGAAIVVSAGTALVVDVLGRDGAFEGGVILAGFRMQAKALFETADQLPLAQWHAGDDPPPVIGRNTEAAIGSGLFWGAVGAVREIIAQVEKELAHAPQVFVTGGDLARLAPLIGGDARFVPNMVLAGIAIAARGEGRAGRR